MDIWTPLLLSLGILMLSTVQVSTAELLTVQDDMMVMSTIVDMSLDLKNFGETQESSMELSRQILDAVHGFAEILNTSLSAHGDTLARLLRRPPQLHSENCTASLRSLSDAVATLSQVNVDLNSMLADKDQKVKTLTQENAHLQNQVNATEEKFKSFLQSAGFEHYPGFGFYKYFSHGQMWDEAKQTCKSWGSHLGIVNSREEAKVYAAIIAPRYPLIKDAYSPYNFHSGFKQVGNTQQFQTLDGVPLSAAGYAEWISGGPPSDYQELCGSITVDAKLQGAPCYMRLAYICELEDP